MNIETLREFSALGRALNYTKAARQLNMDQSTLSRHVQALERELGVELFSRTSRVVRLTKAGELFLGEVIDTLEHLDLVIAQMRAIAGPEKPSLTLGGILTGGSIQMATTSVLTYIHKNKLDLSVRLYEPHTSPSLTAIGASDPYTCLDQGLIDLALLFRHSEEEPEGVQRKALYNDDFILVVDESHPLANRGTVRLPDLEPYVLRMPTLYEENNQWVALTCKASGFDLKTRTVVVDSLSSWCTTRGPEDAFIFNSSSKDAILPTPLSGLVVVPFDDPLAHFEAQAIWRAGDDNPAIPLFLDALAESLALSDLSASSPRVSAAQA